MIDPSADPYRLLLQQPEIRSGLSGVQHPRLIFLQAIHIPTGEGGDPAHSLHTVQDQPFA